MIEALTKAERAYSSSRAVNIVFVGGGSMKSKWIRSLMPIALSIRMVVDKFWRWISGIVVGNISVWNAASV